MSVMVELLLPCLHVPYIATIPNVQLLAVREFHFVPTTNDELFRLSLFVKGVGKAIQIHWNRSFSR